MINSEWIKEYRKNKTAIWIRCTLTNNEELYYSTFDGWLEIKNRCSKDKLFIKALSLQFRSHRIDLDVNNCDGVYLIRSVFGSIGSTKNYFTFGRVISDKVHKQMWMVPELVREKNRDTIDDIKDCFTEAIIYDETKKIRQEQIQA